MTGVFASKTDVGRRRGLNEDYVWVNEQAGIYIVADGMGGQEAGDLASQLAATMAGQFIATHLEQHIEPLSAMIAKELMTGAIEAANETVLMAAREAEQSRPMGAAIVVAVVKPPNIYISHVGDARAYLLQDSELIRLTEDDSWVAQLVAAGLLTEEKARHHPLGHVLTKAVGQNSPVEPTFTEVAAAAGNWLLLCSDGLWNMVNDEQILAELQESNDDPARAVEALVEAANEAGGKDNISVIVIKILP